MNNNQLIALSKKNIWQAINDYRERTYQTDVLDDISEEFVNRLAIDSVNAKADLRALFSTSPVWDDKLQALVINGTRTHNPDFEFIYHLANQIFTPIKYTFDCDTLAKLQLALRFFTEPDYNYPDYIDAIKSLAPKAYAPNKKRSRIFKALCDSLGVTDNTAGSEFQHNFALLADELSARKIDFKLFVSINPAHFLTMSNPKKDKRGSTMVSCHSLNSTAYPYNCGCTGYARDSISFIVFTASDPANPETLNNRKTSRQIFAYKSNNGVLLQSRMYTTKSGDSYGGVNGDTEDGRLYRDLVQREISDLEHVPNLWTTRDYHRNEFGIDIRKDEGFGGYADWLEFTDSAKISVRKDHQHDCQSFSIGTYGLCIKCGEEINTGLYCFDCKQERETCDGCGEPCDETTAVYDYRGNRIFVCNDCLESYCCCEHCGAYHPFDNMTFICDGVYVCQSCLEERYSVCDYCDEYNLTDDLHVAVNHFGDEILICENCLDHYQTCDECGRYVYHNDVITAYNCDAQPIHICPDCRDNGYYAPCDVCGRIFQEDALNDGICDECKAKKDGEAV